MSTRHLVLIGLPGSGKSTIGRRLHQQLGYEFIDTDELIEQRAGMSIPEIFSSQGEDAFREQETAAIDAALRGHYPRIVALGGGAVVREENRRLLERHTVIYIQASAVTAARHVGNGQGRPLMAGTNVRATMERLLQARGHLYEQCATITVPTDGKSRAAVTAMTMEALRERGEHGRVIWVGECPTLAQPAPAGSYPVVMLPAAAPVPAPSDAPETTPTPVPAQQATSSASQTEDPADSPAGSTLADSLCEAVAAAPHGGQGGVAVMHAQCLSSIAQQLVTTLEERGWRARALPVPDGEAAKNYATLTEAWDALGDWGMTRDGLIVGLGGGATTDLAGFVAASWLRGVPVIQVPTTLLAMVDAAVGGKTGIDTPAGKNLVGAFHPPSAVLIDPRLLSTLPARELRAGFGEIIKCGFISDPQIGQIVDDAATSGQLLAPEVLSELIARSVAVKAAVVSSDLKESGLREILNYGHTYAHAIESLSDYRWLHGEAVAVGCVFAAEVAARMGMITPEIVADHRRRFAAAGLPVSFPAGREHFARMRQLMSKDKKARGAGLRMVFLRGEAQVERCAAPADEILEAAHQAVTAAPASVILVGPPGSGVSEIAAELATTQGGQLTDVSQTLADRHGHSPQDALVYMGEERYRAAEVEIATQALRQCHEPGHIVALSSGALADEQLRREVSRAGEAGAVVVGCDASTRLLASRNGLNAPRSVALGQVHSTFVHMLERERELVANVSQHRVDTSESTARECAWQIASDLVSAPPA